MAKNAAGRLEGFAMGGGNAIYHQRQTSPNSISFAGWAYLGGHRLQDLAVARQMDDRLQLFVVGGDGQLDERHQVVANGSFAEWSLLGGAGLRRVEVATNPDGRLVLLGLTVAGELQLAEQTVANGPFGAWRSLTGPLPSTTRREVLS